MTTNNRLSSESFDGSLLVTIATFNEQQSIGPLVQEILLNVPEAEVLVIDDNSPDGTASVVEELAYRDSRVHLIVRTNREGVGAALLDGFGWAMAQGFDLILNLDADFSHDPAAVRALASVAAGTTDIAIGSRYAAGVRVINWECSRLLLSLAVNGLLRRVFNLEIEDSTSGFRCFRRSALATLISSKLKSKRHSIHGEMTVAGKLLGLSISEVPICYTSRKVGNSKFQWKMLLQASPIMLSLIGKALRVKWGASNHGRLFEPTPFSPVQRD